MKTGIVARQPGPHVEIILGTVSCREGVMLHPIRYHLFTPKLLSISVPGDLRQIVGWVILCDPIPSVARKYPIS